MNKPNVYNMIVYQTRCKINKWRQYAKGSMDQKLVNRMIALSRYLMNISLMIMKTPSTHSHTLSKRSHFPQSRLNDTWLRTTTSIIHFIQRIPHRVLIFTTSSCDIYAMITFQKTKDLWKKCGTWCIDSYSRCLTTFYWFCHISGIRRL